MGLFGASGSGGVPDGVGPKVYQGLSHGACPPVGRMYKRVCDGEMRFFCPCALQLRNIHEEFLSVVKQFMDEDDQWVLDLIRSADAGML
jgi:hypothetical protein